MVIIVLVNCSSILGSDNIRQLIYELVVDKVLPNTTKWRISTKKYATFSTIMIGISGNPLIYQFLHAHNFLILSIYERLELKPFNLEKKPKAINHLELSL